MGGERKGPLRSRKSNPTKDLKEPNESRFTPPSTFSPVEGSRGPLSFESRYSSKVVSVGECLKKDYRHTKSSKGWTSGTCEPQPKTRVSFMSDNGPVVKSEPLTTNLFIPLGRGLEQSNEVSILKGDYDGSFGCLS